MRGWFVFAAGVVSVALAVFGYRKAFRAKLTRPARFVMWVTSVVLGGAAGFALGYPLDDNTRIYGFPLPAAVFQREPNGPWLDYVGPLTMPFACLNAVVGIGVFLYAGAALLSRWAPRRGTGDPGPTA